MFRKSGAGKRTAIHNFPGLKPIDFMDIEVRAYYAAYTSTAKNCDFAVL
jgi:hypothetical protein